MDELVEIRMKVPFKVHAWLLNRDAVRRPTARRNSSAPEAATLVCGIYSATILPSTSMTRKGARAFHRRHHRGAFECCPLLHRPVKEAR